MHTVTDDIFIWAHRAVWTMFSCTDEKCPYLLTHTDTTIQIEWYRDSPTVASQKHSMLTSGAMFAPISTAHSMFNVRRITFDISPVVSELPVTSRPCQHTHTHTKMCAEICYLSFFHIRVHKTQLVKNLLNLHKQSSMRAVMYSHNFDLIIIIILKVV